MNCLLCKQPLTYYLTKNGYRLYRCSRCALVRTDLGATYDTFVRRFYSREYFEGDPTRSAYSDYEHDKPLIVRNMRKFLSFIKRHKIEGRLLDVGCAFGYFVELAQSHGYEAYGFDASVHATKEARVLLGTEKIKHGTVRSVSYRKKSFDVISLFDVFEHLDTPLLDMKKITTLLADDGIVILATGDTQSLAAKILKRRWTFFIPPQHLYFFNKKNVTMLLREAGLEPVSWYRVGKWLSLGYVLHLARTTGESTFADMLYKKIDKTFLMRIPLYIPMKDNMVIVARKRSDMI